MPPGPCQPPTPECAVPPAMHPSPGSPLSVQADLRGPENPRSFCSQASPRSPFLLESSSLPPISLHLQDQPGAPFFRKLWLCP